MPLNHLDSGLNDPDNGALHWRFVFLIIGSSMRVGLLPPQSPNDRIPIHKIVHKELRRCILKKLCGLVTS